MESLYCLSLRYLVKNYNLINFTKLNPTTSNDLFIAIKNPYYLKQHIKCRVIHKWAAIISFLVKNYVNTKLLRKITYEEYYTPIIEGRPQYITGLAHLHMGYTHDIINNKSYDFNLYNIKRFEHFIVKDSDFLEKNKTIFKSNCRMVMEDCAFNEFPDLIKWATENSYISIPIYVPLNIITNVDDINKKIEEQIYDQHYL